MYANCKKCEFGNFCIEYFGYVISVEGVVVDEGKVRVMLDWMELKVVKELRGFLGLIGYYRKFV